MKGGDESRQSAATSRNFPPASILTAVLRIGAVLVLVAYVLAVHLMTARGHTPLLALALGAAPLFIVVDVNIARTRGVVWAVVFMIVFGALFWSLRGTLEHEARRIVLAQHIGINLFLCWLFGHSLSGGKEALVTRFARAARAVRGSAMPAEVVSYTRRVTLAWALFFMAIAFASLALYALAPLSVWSVFANLLNLPLVGAMFIGEYVYRLRRLGSFGQTSIVDGFRAFRNHSSQAKLAHGSPDKT